MLGLKKLPGSLFRNRNHDAINVSMSKLALWVVRDHCFNIPLLDNHAQISSSSIHSHSHHDQEAHVEWQYSFYSKAKVCILQDAKNIAWGIKFPSKL
jgi:hypothetical protein